MKGVREKVCFWGPDYILLFSGNHDFMTIRNQNKFLLRMKIVILFLRKIKFTFFNLVTWDKTTPPCYVIVTETMIP